MSYNGRTNNLTGNKKSDEWYTPEFVVNKCYEIVEKEYNNPKILCPFDTDKSEFVKVGKKKKYSVQYNIEGDLQGDYDLILTNPPFSLNSFEMFLQTGKDFIIVCPETFIFSVKFFNLYQKYNFHYKLYSPKQRVYFIDENGKQNRPNFHTVIIAVSRKYEKNIIHHFLSGTRSDTE